MHSVPASFTIPLRISPDGPRRPEPEASQLDTPCRTDLPVSHSKQTKVAPPARHKTRGACLLHPSTSNNTQKLLEIDLSPSSSTKLSFLIEILGRGSATAREIGLAPIKRRPPACPGAGRAGREAARRSKVRRGGISLLIPALATNVPEPVRGAPLHSAAMAFTTYHLRLTTHFRPSSTSHESPVTTHVARHETPSVQTIAKSSIILRIRGYADFIHKE
jgi:hypothetical protein